MKRDDGRNINDCGQNVDLLKQQRRFSGEGAGGGLGVPGKNRIRPPGNWRVILSPRSILQKGGEMTRRNRVRLYLIAVLTALCLAMQAYSGLAQEQTTAVTDSIAPGKAGKRYDGHGPGKGREGQSGTVIFH